MSDEMLSRRLGKYQKMSQIWTAVGLLGVFGGIVSYFAVQDPLPKGILTAALFGGGLFCALFLADGAKKKRKSLLKEQLGEFFSTEYESVFGPEPHTANLPIDPPSIKALGLVEKPWEESLAEDFHKGSCRGMHFSAANVRLDHLYQRGSAHDRETCRSTVFQGVFLRCETRLSAPSPVRINVNVPNGPLSAVTGKHVFGSGISVTEGDERFVPEFLSPQFIDILSELEQRTCGRIHGLQWSGKVFSLALETTYRFAAVDENTDMRDSDAVRRSYRDSLRGMTQILDILLKNTVLFAGQN